MILDFNMTLFTMVLMRMSGCILFNPIFGRRNVPVIVRAGMTLLLAFFTFSLIPDKNIEVTNLVVYGVVMVKELLIGFVIGYIIQMFLAVIIIAGEIMDLQMGLSMSQIYDPQSNISMPVSASIINAMWMLLFFASNGHTTLIRLFIQLGTVSPYGELALSQELFKDMASLLSLILIYAVKLALPILAVEIIVEMGVGLLMKAVPQINVFIVNLQLKIFIGFVAILLLVPAYSKFLERLLTLMFDQIIRTFG